MSTWLGSTDMIPVTLEQLLTVTPENIALASLGMATVAAFFALLSFLRSFRRGNSSALTKFDAMQLMRGETDALKAAGDERERRMVTGLANTVIEKTRESGAKIDRFITQIDGRAAAVAEKLNGDMTQLGADANQKSDSLRRLVEERFADSISKQAIIARELREELIAGMQNIGRNVSSTLEQASQQQGKAQEALRVAVESRLEAIRLESASKFEEMRSTFGEKLQTTVETRIDQ